LPPARAAARSNEKIKTVARIILSAGNRMLAQRSGRLIEHCKPHRAYSAKARDFRTQGQRAGAHCKILHIGAWLWRMHGSYRAISPDISWLLIVLWPMAHRIPDLKFETRSSGLTRFVLLS
jgi:hypothetical protein